MANLNDVYVDRQGQLWYVKTLPSLNNKYMLMADSYEQIPDRELSEDGLVDFLKIGILKLAWTAKEAANWK